jgi:hypothetical protein
MKRRRFLASRAQDIFILAFDRMAGSNAEGMPVFSAEYLQRAKLQDRASSNRHRQTVHGPEAEQGTRFSSRFSKRDESLAATSIERNFSGLVQP